MVSKEGCHKTGTISGFLCRFVVLSTSTPFWTWTMMWEKWWEYLATSTTNGDFVMRETGHGEQNQPLVISMAECRLFFQLEKTNKNKTTEISIQLCQFRCLFPTHRFFGCSDLWFLGLILHGPGGTVTWTPPTDTSQLQGYSVYLAQDATGTGKIWQVWEIGFLKIDRYLFGSIHGAFWF